MLGGVFICYRRGDTAGFAGRIYDRLARKLGRDNVFIDVDNIQPGFDFVEVLTERVGKCDALVAVIGKDWVSSADRDNRRRIDDPHDFVRIEIEAALDRGVRLIPVLVDGAAMPRPGELPDSMKKLSRRQGVHISHAQFDSDVRKLTRVLSLLEEELRQPAEAERAAREEHEKREAAEEVDKAAEARRLAEAKAARRAEEERRLGEAAEADRAAREEREKRDAAGAAEKAEQARRLAEAEAQGADDERHAREAVRVERTLREERDSREAIGKQERERLGAQADRGELSESIELSTASKSADAIAEMSRVDASYLPPPTKKYRLRGRSGPIVSAIASVTIIAVVSAAFLELRSRQVTPFAAKSNSPSASPTTPPRNVTAAAPPIQLKPTAGTHPEPTADEAEPRGKVVAVAPDPLQTPRVLGQPELVTNAAAPTSKVAPAAPAFPATFGALGQPEQSPNATVPPRQISPPPALSETPRALGWLKPTAGTFPELAASEAELRGKVVAVAPDPLQTPRVLGQPELATNAAASTSKVAPAAPAFPATFRALGQPEQSPNATVLARQISPPPALSETLKALGQPKPSTASRQTTPKAEYEIGGNYFYGRGIVGLDYRQAMAWYRKAADQGYADAQFMVGQIYSNGLGVSRDYDQAREWYQKAADQGNLAAKYSLEKLDGGHMPTAPTTATTSTTPQTSAARNDSTILQGGDNFLTAWDVERLQTRQLRRKGDTNWATTIFTGTGLLT